MAVGQAGLISNQIGAAMLEGQTLKGVKPICDPAADLAVPFIGPRLQYVLERSQNPQIVKRMNITSYNLGISPHNGAGLRRAG